MDVPLSEVLFLKETEVITTPPGKAVPDCRLESAEHIKRTSTAESPENTADVHSGESRQQSDNTPAEPQSSLAPGRSYERPQQQRPGYPATRRARATGWRDESSGRQMSRSRPNDAVRSNIEDGTGPSVLQAGQHGGRREAQGQPTTQMRRQTSNPQQASVSSQAKSSQDSNDGKMIIEDWESIVSDKWVTDELEWVDVGSYLGLPRDLLPEVFFESELPVWEELHPRGGCRGLEEELAASDMDLVMYREATHVLATEIAEKSSKKIYLVGPPSSGKSIAMATVVAQMRSKGWLVMYIPEARQLTSGGFFHRHAEHGKWDTPEIAKLILHYLVAGNPARVDEVKSERYGHSLRELAQLAIESTDPHETVDLFLDAKETVTAAPNTLIAIDNYQALYSPTDYGQWLSQTKRRVLEADDLRVAAALKVLEQSQLPDGVVLCAANRSSSFSPRTRFPMEHGAAILTVPRMTFEEWSVMSDYYRLTGATAALSPYAIKKAYFTMVANAAEYRKFAPLISADEEDNGDEAQAMDIDPLKRIASVSA